MFFRRIPIFLFSLFFFLSGPSMQAATKSTVHQAIFEIENISCNYCLAKVNSTLISLDHTARLQIITYPRIFSVIHHSSLNEGTIVSSLSDAGFPTKILGSAIVTASSLQSLPVASIEEQVIQKPCSASAQAWKNLISRVHHGYLRK